MTYRHILLTTAITAVLLISAGAYAGGGGMAGGTGGGMGMMGGQGHGMMGSSGADMMGSSPNDSNPWISPQSRTPSSDLKKQFEREKLREEIGNKRQELSELYTAEKPDRVLIDKKIAELHALEADYDRRLFGVE